MGVVRRDEDATGASFVFLNGRFDTKVAPEETGGAFCIFDSFRFEPGGPPLHVHANQDEWFLVTEGEFEFQVGDTRARLGPGDSIHGPRGVPHSFASTTPTARMVVLFVPAGGMQDFFHVGSTKGAMSPGEFAALSAEYGMEVVGPPLRAGA